MLWNISHPDLLTVAECDAFDLVATPSARHAEQLALQTSTPVVVVEQATDPVVFFPEHDPAHQRELVFVGNSRGIFRPILRDLLPTERDLAVWGQQWERFLPAGVVAGQHLPNDAVRRAYSSAALVLNDHWDDMREQGIVSNRVFDALACGALVVSDHLPEIAERFGDAVVTLSHARGAARDGRGAARRPRAAGAARRRRPRAGARRAHLPPSRGHAARRRRAAQDRVRPSDPLLMSTITDAGLASGWREKALAALEDGRVAEAHEWLRQALAETTELEWLNDLGVLAHQRGRADEAEALLRAVLAIDPEDRDAAENLAALAAAQAEPDARWRRSQTLGGPDPGMYERAFPGMPRPDIISEHTSRYAYALGLVGGKQVLDLGCGTGYGSEMLSWSAASVRGFDLWQPGADEHPQWPGVKRAPLRPRPLQAPAPPGGPRGHVRGDRAPARMRRARSRSRSARSARSSARSRTPSTTAPG